MGTNSIFCVIIESCCQEYFPYPWSVSTVLWAVPWGPWVQLGSSPWVPLVWTPWCHRDLLVVWWQSLWDLPWQPPQYSWSSAWKSGVLASGKCWREKKISRINILQIYLTKASWRSMLNASLFSGWWQQQTQPHLQPAGFPLPQPQTCGRRVSFPLLVHMTGIQIVLIE